MYKRQLHEALPILHGAGRVGMALLSAAWLAGHEQRSDLAVQALARFDAPGRTGSEFGPGTFIRRSVGQLWARLRADLGDDRVVEGRAAAEDLSDVETLRRVMAVAPLAAPALSAGRGRPPPPRTAQSPPSG